LDYIESTHKYLPMVLNGPHGAGESQCSVGPVVQLHLWAQWAL